MKNALSLSLCRSAWCLLGGCWLVAIAVTGWRGGSSSVTQAVSRHAWGRIEQAAQVLPLTQDWSDKTLITSDHDWSRVPGIEGNQGQGLTSATGTDPQTILAPSAAADDLHVLANRTAATMATGGVAEFDGLPNPTIGLQGSGTADAPHLVITLNCAQTSDVQVRYTLRDLDASADDAVQAVALQYRIGTSGNFINVPAGFVADATTGPRLATQVTAVRVELPAAVNQQPLVQLRIITANANGNDEWVGVDDLRITGRRVENTLSLRCTPNGFGENSPTPSAATNCTLTRAGNTTGALTATLRTTNANKASVPANIHFAAGQTRASFPVATRDNTARDGTQPVTVTARADGAASASVELLVTDDETVINAPIYTIQGNGARSPLVGQSILTRGVITAITNTGFFLQAAPNATDNDPATSDGILVFFSITPPPSVVVGNLVEVFGIVAEFVPTSDPGQPPLTQIIAPTVTVISTNHPLPVPVILTTTFPAPNGAFDQLERLEGMRVQIPSLTVISPTEGNTNEASATGTSNGRFFGVVTGMARPRREAGIRMPDAPTQGTIPPLPRFDNNPERIRIDSRGQTNAPLLPDVTSGAVIRNLVGVLTYGFRNYALLPDPAPQPAISVTGIRSAQPLAIPAVNQFTIASFNLERFFDTVNDPGINEVVLTPEAFANRLRKTSLAIRTILRTPDILGVIEMENLMTLQALANQINLDAVAAGEANPRYVGYLEEGNDVGGIDVGFLVKTGNVAGQTPRVRVQSVTQVGKTATYASPDGATDLLNDRPPLVLQATVNHASGQSVALTVIANHLRSLNNVDDPTPANNGWPSNGARVRAKRQAQAEFLARLIQTRQQANPAERIIALGDFNAFEVNDGLTDLISTIVGTPTLDEQTVVTGDGADLVNPDLTNLVRLAPHEYSYVFDGNIQSLDHLLVNQPLRALFAAYRVAHLNADFPESYRSNPARPERISDHDAPVGYFNFPAMR